MSSTAPSPGSSNNSPPSPPLTSLIPPTSSIVPPLTTNPPPPPQSTPPPVSSPSPPANSAPPPASLPPPPVVSSPPPAASSPPPPVDKSPPPPVDKSPPPSTPVTTPPPAASASPPPPSPPPPAQTPPPTSQPSPPSPVVSAPPPSKNKSPPPPAATPPSPATASPPPPVTADSPPPSGSPPSVPSNSPPPPPPGAKPPKHSRSPPPPSLSPPPPVSQDASPPPALSPPDTFSPPPVNGTQPTPSSPIPPSSVPPTVAPGDNTPSGSVPSPPGSIKPVESPPLTTTTSANSDSSGGMSTGGAVGIGIGTVLVLSLLVAICVYRKRKKKKVSGYHAGHVMPSPLGSSPSSDASYIKGYSSAPLISSNSNSDFIYSPSESGGLGNPRSTFTYEELSEATDGFSTENLLGEGGFGCVYKGVLPDGREVAVKQLKVGGSQGEREFTAEIETISRVHHRHLVSLVGYCISDHHRLLAYDFVANDTLYHHLHENDEAPLDWPMRVKVATGAARGLAYLHEDCHPRIIHRDIKSSNILLDKNFDAQVSDFGLARLSLDVYTHVSTRVMGTFGYMAPEYASSGKLTDRSDVYSFGVVLLELITGRKPVDGSQPLGDESLVEWARPLMNNAIEKKDLEVLIDAKLGNNYIETEMYRMVEAAAACIRHSAAKRPRMGQVLRALDSISDDQDLTNGTRLGQSEVYDEGNQSAEIRMFQKMAFGTQDYSTSAFSRSSWGSIV